MDTFLARQPIYDRLMRVYGYEMLFRDSNINNYSCIDGDIATYRVIVDTFLVMGVDKTTKGKRAFINFTEKLLLEDIPLILPRSKTVIEILEDVRPNENVIEKCKKYKDKGYKLALDDYCVLPENDELLKLSDIVKIDFFEVPSEKRQSVVNELKRYNVKLLAEKIETKEDYEEAKNLGFSYYQGYYFQHPVILKGIDIPMSSVSKLKILNIISKETIDYNKIEKIVKEDVSLSYKIFRYINSSAFCFKNRITSIKRALVLMGKREIYKWISLLLVIDVMGTPNDEVIKMAISRAKFCELISQEMKECKKSYEYYLIGLFSNLDFLLERSMEEVLDEICIPKEVKDALLGVNNNLKKVLDIVLLYEKGMWDEVIEGCKELKINSNVISNYYLEAIKFSEIVA